MTGRWVQWQGWQGQQQEQVAAMMGSRRVQLEQAVAMRGSRRCYLPRYAGVVAKMGTQCCCSRPGCPWVAVAKTGSPQNHLPCARLLACRSQVEEKGTRTGWGKEVCCPALVQGLEPLALVVAKESWAGYHEQQAGEWERWMAWRVAAKMGRTRLPACSGCQKLYELSMLGMKRQRFSGGLTIACGGHSDG